MRGQGTRRVVPVGVLLAGVLLSVVGCGGAPSGQQPEPSTSPGVSPSGGATSPTAPADGILLTTLGFENAPSGFSIPRSAIFVTAVDQPNVTTLVLRSPAPTVVASYLRTNLPAAGFTITAADPGDDTFTFTGGSWYGSFTATGEQSAIRLSPTP